jgi:uncharacterized protein
MFKRNQFSKRLLTALVASFALIGPASAQAPDEVVEKARADGVIGEQADGYIGCAKAAANSGDLKARVDQINIKRRAFYTDLAGKRGVTVNEVGAATACELFKSRVPAGHFYRNEAGAWAQATAANPVKLPGYCG